MLPAYSVEAQAPWVHCYALILLVTVVEMKWSVISGLVRARCGLVWVQCASVRSGVTRCSPVRLCHTPSKLHNFAADYPLSFSCRKIEKFQVIRGRGYVRVRWGVIKHYGGCCSAIKWCRDLGSWIFITTHSTIVSIELQLSQRNKALSSNTAISYTK